MPKVIGIGKQRYDRIIENNLFYIDKTMFIKEWWENQDDVTLITRPRRFGKTLNMDMLKCFFSNEYKDRGDLFEGLNIWKEEKYREIQGTYPVIFLSFAGIKGNNYEFTRQQICIQIADIYEKNRYLLERDILSDNEKEFYKNVNIYMSDATLSESINKMSSFMSRYYGKNVIILLDEYDTPMQEAYVNGYWEELVSFTRSFFNATFKSNLYLERAVITGITRVSKESIFSDLNNLKVITVESDEYSDTFGFSEEEVFLALDDFNLSDKKQIVKEWYDGFTFGSQRDIYNPWSIINFLENKKIDTYWADTSSNSLINHLIKKSVPEIKELMELLLKRESIEVTFDDQIVFNQLDKSKNAIWSLLVASGYLKIDDIEYKGLLLKPWYHISITNLETVSMFANMFAGWFENPDARYNDFIKSLLNNDLKGMNYYMNKVALATFSYFDTGKNPSETLEPERFYHGFVLGLIVELSDRYEVKSNRESGFGRYDVMIIPLDKSEKAIVLEFKVHESDEEKTFEETVSSALAQIEEKKYDTELINAGVKKENIRHYGFAFEGKKVLIGTDE
ncbi:AAA family ATPase [Butyribacter sp.]|uniref:AAA family ATPase n=1 Tax=Butyribacter sp. TaxID=2822465 RepID=UPI002A93E446|nr:AAA family ATPase [Butyribacter sp.]